MPEETQLIIGPTSETPANWELHLDHLGGTVQKVLQAFLGSKIGSTQRNYASDLVTFADWSGKPGDVSEALTQFFALSALDGHIVVTNYRSYLNEAGMAPNTINRKLATLRSVTRFAKIFGKCDWLIDLRGVRAETYRDTRGPGVEAVLTLIHKVDEIGEEDSDAGMHARRDGVILRLLYLLALRRGEVSSLDIKNIDLSTKTVWILGKARGSREGRTLPDNLVVCLEAWITERQAWAQKHPGRIYPPDADALFIHTERGRQKGEDGSYQVTRFSGGSIYEVLTSRGMSILGKVVRPHGLRHTAITRVLDETHGDLRAAQRFSRHKSITMLSVYDDSRVDMAGQAAGLLAEAISSRRLGLPVTLPDAMLVRPMERVDFSLPQVEPWTPPNPDMTRCPPPPGTCAFCQNPFTSKGSVSYLIPPSRGGSPIGPMVRTCDSCTTERGDRILWVEWSPPNPDLARCPASPL